MCKINLTYIRSEITILPDFWMEPKQQRIDYIFFRGPGLKVEASKVVLNRSVQGLFPSDHFGVMADFRIRER